MAYNFYVQVIQAFLSAPLISIFLKSCHPIELSRERSGQTKKSWSGFSVSLVFAGSIPAHAIVAQLVEQLPSRQQAAGSFPVYRSGTVRVRKACQHSWKMFHRLKGDDNGTLPDVNRHFL